jgi:hypothetical protein
MSSISRILISAVLVTASGVVYAQDAAPAAQPEAAAAPAAATDTAEAAKAVAAPDAVAAPEAAAAAAPEAVAAPAAPAAAAAPEAVAAPAAAPADSAVNANYRDEPSWMPAVDPTKGLVIIYRERHFVGGGARMKYFYDDGAAFPPLKNGKFVYVYLTPGDHKIYGDKKKQSDAHLLAIEPGDVHFFEASIAMGAWKANTDLLETDASVAKQKITALQK